MKLWIILVPLVLGTSTLSATQVFDDTYFVSPEDQELMSILAEELPPCTTAEMGEFDKFLANKKEAVLTKWGNTGIGGWEEYLDKAVYGMIETYYSSVPENQSYRDEGCKNFVAYCNNAVSVRQLNEGGNSPKADQYVEDNYTSAKPTPILAIACKTGLEADLIACLTAIRPDDCDNAKLTQK